MATTTIELVDPATLVIAPNIRKATKITDAFIGSIQEYGVKVPIEVQRGVDGGLEVKDGQRRTLAALQAGLAEVPVLVVERAEDDSVRIVDQLVMNEQREPLTRAERVRAVQELALFGVRAGDIVRRTSVPKADVEKSIAVANSTAALEAITEHEITLDQAAVLVEFEKHPKVLKDLIERARDGRQFDYYVREAQKRISLEASKRELTAKLKAEGTKKVNEPQLRSYNGTGSVLTDLTTEAGKKITPAAHKKCPGHAAMVYAGYYASEAEIVYGCLDWKANGHKRGGAREETAEERAAREQKERERAERAQAAEISRELRREFIAGLLQRDVSKLEGLHDLNAFVVAGGGSEPAGWVNHEWRRLALTWLGVDEAAIADGRPFALLSDLVAAPKSKPLTMLLASTLAKLDMVYERYSQADCDVAFYDALERWGYQLNEHERADRETQRAELAVEAS